MPTQLAKQMPQKLMRLENMGFYTKLHIWLAGFYWPDHWCSKKSKAYLQLNLSLIYKRGMVVRQNKIGAMKSPSSFWPYDLQGLRKLQNKHIKHAHIP